MRETAVRIVRTHDESQMDAEQIESRAGNKGDSTGRVEYQDRKNLETGKESKIKRREIKEE